MKRTLTRSFALFLATASTLLLASEPTEIEIAYGERLFTQQVGKTEIQVEIIISNYPTDADLSKMPVTVSLVTLPFGQKLERFEHVGDGTFRLSIPKIYASQQGWLKVGSLFFGELILSNKLRIDIDGAQVKPKSKYKTDGVLFSGSDGNLNRLANEFISFRRQEQLDLKRRMSDLTRSNFEPAELTERMRTLRDAYAQIARDFDPIYYEEWARQEIQGEYLTQLFSALLKTRTSQTLEELPFRDELDNFEPLAATNSQIRIINYVRMYANKLPSAKAQQDATETLCDIVLRACELPWNAKAKTENAELLKLIHARKNQQPYDLAHFNALLEKSAKDGIAHGKLNQANAPNATLQQSLPTPVYELAKISKLPTSPEDLAITTYILKKQIEHPKYLEFLAYLESQALREGQATADKLQAISHAKPLALLGETAGQAIQLHEFPDIDGTQIYEQIRATLPDRSLVLDFWGPWCPPCMNDLPYGKILHEKLQDQPITFIYFGCRTTRQPWEDAIIQHDIGGIHILLTESQNVDLMKRFGGTGYPTLRFVDRNGLEHRDSLQRYKTANPELLTKLANQ